LLRGSVVRGPGRADMCRGPELRLLELWLELLPPSLLRPVRLVRLLRLQ
jgi:hypothetical protein